MSKLDMFCAGVAFASVVLGTAAGCAGQKAAPEPDKLTVAECVSVAKPHIEQAYLEGLKACDPQHELWYKMGQASCEPGSAIKGK